MTTTQDTAALKTGDVFELDGRLVVRTKTDGAFIPESVANLEAVANLNGWGFVREVRCDSFGPALFVSVGRNPGVAGHSDRETRGVLYRIRWDLTRYKNKFDLVAKHMRSSDNGNRWEKSDRTIYQIVAEIQQNARVVE